MSKRPGADDFMRGAFILLARGGLAQEFGAAASDAENRLHEAEAQAMKASRDESLGWANSETRARVIAQAYERAERDAKKAAAIAKAGKDRAVAVEALLVKQREIGQEQMRKAKEAERSANLSGYGEERSSTEDSDTEAARRGGNPESSGDESQTEAA